ncbi:MAG: hypothetical protein LCH56_15445 [Proteobacteria bacterium]|nr:hypothetical protein [Pseudomonadota bacterium]
MPHLHKVSVLTLAVALVAGAAYAQTQKSAPKEQYQRTPMPAGIQVIQTDEEGPLFATTEGKTLYQWPFIQLRNGDAGDQKGKPTCTDTLFKENAGLMSPYPGGFIMPDADTRMSCVELWPPVGRPMVRRTSASGPSSSIPAARCSGLTMVILCTRRYSIRRRAM